MKIYTKKGRLDYSEKRMVKALERIAEENPDKFGPDFRPATSKEELERLFKAHGVTDVDFTETKKDTGSGSNAPTPQNPSANGSSGSGSSSGESLIDPFNAQSPNVREYVTSDNGFKEDSGESGGQAGPGASSFPEPTSFSEAFHIPGSDEAKAQQEKGQQQQQQQAGKTSSQSGGVGNKQTKGAPLNPSFEDMDTGRKNRSTKRFAKYIVEIVCTLAEKGLVWWGTKGVTEAELAKLELKGEIDLSLIVTLNGTQEATVKEFFINQCIAIEHAVKFTDEEKKDLADALTLVLLEKGAAPTPMQELLVAGISAFGSKLLAVMQIKAQNTMVLNQLKKLGGNGTGDASQYQEDQQEDADQHGASEETKPETQNNTSTAEDIEGNERLNVEDIPVGSTVATME